MKVHYLYEVIKTNFDKTIEVLEPCETKRQADNAKHYWDKLYQDVTIREVDHAKK
jgi:hypothetical protein